MHHETCYPIKAQCPSLVSDLIIQARVKATEAIKSAFTRQKQGRAVSQPYSQLCAARYNLHTYKVYWPKAEVSLSTTQGRMRIGFTVPPYALRYIGNPTATADLLYRKGGFWLHIVVSLKGSEFVAGEQVIGVDLGLNRPPSLRDVGVPSWVRERGRMLISDTSGSRVRCNRKGRSRLAAICVSWLASNCDSTAIETTL